MTLIVNYVYIEIFNHLAGFQIPDFRFPCGANGY